ncbi:MAG: esterase [Verrucomicrobiota bacterium]
MNSSLRFLLMTFLGLVSLRANVQAQNDPPAGTERVQLSVEGVAREALVAAPAPAKTLRTPVVFVFHGHSGSASKVAREYGMEREWPEAIIVYMQGLNTPGRFIDPEGKQTGWQMRPGAQGDRDLKFFDAMIARLKQDYQVDEQRFYALGHSGGGYFTYLLWATRDDVLAGVAPLASEAAENLPALKPKPALLLAGEKDKQVKYEWQRASMNALRLRNGCSAEGTAFAGHCTLYPSASGTPIVEFVHPGGHEVPKGAMAAIARFFKEYPKR